MGRIKISSHFLYINMWILFNFFHIKFIYLHNNLTMNKYMKKLNKILKGILLDTAYSLPIYLIFTLVILQLIFNFNIVIYCISAIFMLILSKPWINFVEKKFKKQN